MHAPRAWCQLCKRVVRGGDVAKHMARKHRLYSPFFCIGCLHGFATEAAFDAHMCQTYPDPGQMAIQEEGPSEHHEPKEGNAGDSGESEASEGDSDESEESEGGSDESEDSKGGSDELEDSERDSDVEGKAFDDGGGSEEDEGTFQQPEEDPEDGFTVPLGQVPLRITRQQAQASGTRCE